MNKDILCKGKREDNGEWVTGYAVKHGDCWWIYTGKVAINESVCNEFGLPATKAVAYLIDSDTLCRCTGLKDINRKKIFEGDIVEYEDEAPGQVECHDHMFMNRGVIVYADGACHWTNAVAATLTDTVYKGCADCKVIGNIYDNPGLLGGG